MLMYVFNVCNTYCFSCSFWSCVFVKFNGHGVDNKHFTPHGIVLLNFVYVLLLWIKKFSAMLKTVRDCKVP